MRSLSSALILAAAPTQALLLTSFARVPRIAAAHRAVHVALSNAQLPTPAELDDPREWLEEVEGKEPLDWVSARNAHALEAIGQPESKPIYQRILDNLDSDEKIPYIGRCDASPSEDCSTHTHDP